jgi:signal transduction histidine kinase
LGAVRSDLSFSPELTGAARVAQRKESAPAGTEPVAKAAYLRSAALRIEQELFRQRFGNWRLTLMGMTAIAWMIAAMYRHLDPAVATLRWAALETAAFALAALLCMAYERYGPANLDTPAQRHWLHAWIAASVFASALAGTLPWFLPATNGEAQLSSAALVSILMVALVVSRASRLLIHVSVAAYAVSLSAALVLHAHEPWAVPLCLLYTAMLLGMGLMLNASMRRAIGDQLYARHLHHQLRRSHQRQLTVQQREAALNERQRMMSDLHDGFGAQLIGALRLLERGQIDVPGAAQALRDCVDDLRLTVDANEPAARSLATLLGMLRYRMQPRIEGSGLRLMWQISDLPETASLPAAQSLDLLRILQQGIANVLQHADASEIRLIVRRELRLLEIALEDDGRGLGPEAAQRHGRGISNMQRRAARLGAELRVEPRAGGGTALRLRLRWPAEVVAA